MCTISSDACEDTDPSPTEEGGLQRRDGCHLQDIQERGCLRALSRVLAVKFSDNIWNILRDDVRGGAPRARQVRCQPKSEGGGCASLVGQTIIVPFDVLSQHLMVLGLVKGRGNARNSQMNPLGLDLDKKLSKAALAREVAVRVYRLHGPLGYYRGYAASLAAYVPNSALWWALYTTYQDELLKVAPSWMSILLIQCVAGTLGGFTTTFLTNPLDIVRARLQVQGVGTMNEVFRDLWAEEGLVGLYFKGLSARLVQSACFSFSIILGYETIKRVALSDEFRPRVRW
ncbi:solute carrier family 25 member 44 isoform X2 [Trichoplusia ni]|uniref:Solute carrier family 25 member 44 isoform X2 n=1 Tax=Trichoplusia ni TaxID=7111 RepID=A0A7E5X675_TRINI|nr:solute carrier family 25 member 44 isoform X2 [Trichoplusia ni]